MIQLRALSIFQEVDTEMRMSGIICFRLIALSLTELIKVKAAVWFLYVLLAPIFRWRGQKMKPPVVEIWLRFLVELCLNLDNAKAFRE